MKSNPFRHIFHFFAIASALLGLGMAVIADGGLYDVRGVLAMLAAGSAGLQMIVARREAANAIH